MSDFPQLPFSQEVKLIVAHKNPDLDAIAAAWLFTRYGGKHFTNVTFYFVPPGDRIDDEVLLARGLNHNQVVHVDTGLGPFDHHQPDNTLRDSASSRVYDYLCEQFPLLHQDKALSKMVQHVTDGDHFGQIHWPEPRHPRHSFSLTTIITGLRSKNHFTDPELLQFGFICLDSIYLQLKIQISAEQELREQGTEFTCRWGKAIALENHNDEVLDRAILSGFQIAIRKDRSKEHIRIKAQPDCGIDLTPLYTAVLAKDPNATWYFHPSKCMLLNGARKKQGQYPSQLSLDEIIQLCTEV